MAREKKPRKTRKVRDLAVGDRIGGNNGQGTTAEVFLPIVAIEPSQMEPGVPDPSHRVVTYQLPDGTTCRVRLPEDLDARVPE